MTRPKPITLAEARRSLPGFIIFCRPIPDDKEPRYAFATSLEIAKDHKMPGDLICRVRLERVK